MWNCKHCKNEFEFTRITEKANHSRHCYANPKKLESYLNIKKSLKESYDKKLGEIKDFSVSCESCNNLFVVKEREFQYPSRSAYFCSRRCANKEGGKAKAAKYHKDDVARYTTVAWRHHEKRCVVCGEDKIVAVHHYNENHNDNEPKNLIPLCPTHHHYMHSQHKGIIIKIVEDYIKTKFGDVV